MSDNGVKSSIVGKSAKRGVLLRSLLYGAALGGVGFACASHALTLAPSDSSGAAVIVVILIVGLAVGVWAGKAGDMDPEKPSQRWTGAAAFIVVAGTFASLLDLYRNILPGRGWLLAGLTVGLAVPAYALGMILPELIEWAQAAADEELDHEFDGAVTVVEGVVAGAAVGVLSAAILLAGTLSAGTILIGCALLLLVPLTLRNPAEQQSREAVLYDNVTPFGHLVVTQVEYPGERQPERRLYLNGEEESGQLVRSGAPTLAYIAAAESWLSNGTPPASSYLFLGGGAYTLPRRIAERDPSARIQVVELDPEVTRIAQHFFGLSSNLRIQTVVGDARAYLDREDPAEKFDRIYLDVYGGGETIPYSLITVEAAQALRGRLNPHGMLGVNLIARSVGEEQKALWSVIRTFERVFPHLAVYVHLGRDYPDRQNLLLTARLADPGEYARTTGGFELWPREEWPSVEGSVIFHDLAGAAPSGPNGASSSQRASSEQLLG